MASIATKLIASISTAGAVGGVGYGIHTLTDTSDSVKNYLIQKGFTITKQETASDWDKVLKTYKLEKTQELELIAKPEITASEIKDWCKENLKKNIKSFENSLFKKAVKWCVKYKTIKEKIGTEIKPVKTAEALNSEYSQFPSDLKKSIEKITLTERETQANADGAKTAKWCTENLDRSYSQDKEFFFKYTSQYCFTA